VRGRVSRRIGVALAAALLLVQAIPGWACALRVCATPACCRVMAPGSGTGAAVCCPMPEACGVSGSGPVAKPGGSIAEIRDLSFAPTLASGPPPAEPARAWFEREASIARITRRAREIRRSQDIPVYLRYLRLAL